VHLLELYAVSDKSGKFGAAIAMAATVQSMQTSVRTLAKRSIPHVLDWGDEEQLWTMIQSVLMVFASAEARGLKPLTEESFH
jgi:hypothetical protein